jgi:starch synthase
MRVLHLVPKGTTTAYGGIETYISALSLAQRRLGCAVEVIDVPTVERVPGVMSSLENHLPRDADVIHCHSWYTFQLGRMFAVKRSRPFVLTLHSLESLRPWRRAALGARYDEAVRIEHRAIQCASLIVVPSSSMLSGLSSFGREDVQVIPHGVAAGGPKKSRSDDEARFEMRQLCFVGRCSPAKGVASMLSSMLQLKQEGLDFSSEIVLGPADSAIYSQRVEKLIERLRSSGVQLRLHRSLPRHQALEAFGRSTIAVLPSVYEPFGLARIEAVTSHIPLIHTRGPHIHEIAGLSCQDQAVSVSDTYRTGEETGEGTVTFEEELAHCIAEALTSSERWGELVNRSVGASDQQITWDEVGKRHQDAYRSVC